MISVSIILPKLPLYSSNQNFVLLYYLHFYARLSQEISNRMQCVSSLIYRTNIYFIYTIYLVLILLTSRFYFLIFILYTLYIVLSINPHQCTLMPFVNTDLLY